MVEGGKRGRTRMMRIGRGEGEGGVEGSGWGDLGLSLLRGAYCKTEDFVVNRLAGEFRCE